MPATTSIAEQSGNKTVSSTDPITAATGQLILLALQSLVSRSGLPYGADNYAASYTGDNPTTIVYKVGATTVKTRTFTYTDGKLTNVADS